MSRQDLLHPRAVGGGVGQELDPRDGGLGHDGGEGAHRDGGAIRLGGVDIVPAGGEKRRQERGKEAEGGAQADPKIAGRGCPRQPARVPCGGRGCSGGGKTYLRFPVELPRRQFVLRASVALASLAAAPAARAQDAAPVPAPVRSAGATAPAEAMLRYHLALEARRSGLATEAAALLASAVALDPAAPEPRLAWASVLLEVGEAEDAREALAPLAAWSEHAAGEDGARYARLMGSAAARLGDDDGAVAWYERAVARTPMDLGLRSQLIGRYRARGDEARALVHLEAVAELLPSSAEVRVELGGALLGLERWREAEAAFAEAALMEPGLARAWDGLGMARAGNGDLAGAEEAFRRGLRSAPASAAIYEHLGDALLGGGRASEALQAYRRAEALAPGEARLARKVERAATQVPAAEGATAPDRAPSAAGETPEP